MKNLLIGKSFSYEIVDFTLLWQSNTYRLGGSCYIHLTKGTDCAFVPLSLADFIYLFIISDVTIIAIHF